MAIQLKNHLLNKGTALVLNGEKGLADSDLAQLLDFSDQQRAALTVVVLSNTNVADDCLSFLVGLPRLRELCLNGTNVSDSGPFELFGESLEVINLDNTRFGDLGVAKLRRASNLRVISLGYTRVSDQGVRILGTFPQLREYFLNGMEISDYAKRRVDNAIELADASFAGTFRLVGYQAQMLVRRSMRMATRPAF